MITRNAHRYLAIGILLILLAPLQSCVERRGARTGSDEPTVSDLLQVMLSEEQRLQADSTADSALLAEAVVRHREKVFELLATGVISEAGDLLGAALLLQNAHPERCRDCYLLAYQLAAEARRKGLEAAGVVAATSIDRYLVLSGQPQRFGTQHSTDRDGKYYLIAVDSLTTDAERDEWGIEPLDSIRARISRLNSDQGP